MTSTVCVVVNGRFVIKVHRRQLDNHKDKRKSYLGFCIYLRNLKTLKCQCQEVIIFLMKEYYTQVTIVFPLTDRIKGN